METYFRVSAPAAKSGIAAAVVLGVGRAIGEAMAIMMVAGNAANMPGLFRSVKFLTTAVAQRDVLCCRRVPAEDGPVLHRTGAVSVHYDDQRVFESGIEAGEGVRSMESVNYVAANKSAVLEREQMARAVCPAPPGV